MSILINLEIYGEIKFVIKEKNHVLINLIYVLYILSINFQHNNSYFLKTGNREIASNQNSLSKRNFIGILCTRALQSNGISSLKAWVCTSVSSKELTNPIEVPGSTSWNWFRRRSFHSRWSSSVGNLYAAFLTRDWMWAIDAKNSTSWRRNSQNRFIFFTCQKKN